MHTVKTKRVISMGLGAMAVLALTGCPPAPPEDETIMLPGGVPLEMVWIPAGSFMMGRYAGEQDSFDNEDPEHPVSLGRGFWMGRYEVTKRQWTAVKGTTPWSGQPDVIEDPDSPAVYVSWYDALSFIAQLNGLTGLTFRLPSEAEWEHGCRAGTTTRFYWGDDPIYTSLSDHAWWQGNARDAGQRYGHMAGLKQPNAWNLHDMSGNVWEYCEDDWHEDYIGAPADGAAWVDSPRGLSRVFRGGGWQSGDTYCRSANRACSPPDVASSGYGFRLAR